MRIRVLVLLIALSMPACAEELSHDLTEIAANDTVATLVAHGVAAQKVRQGRTWTVKVPAGAHAKAWGIVRDAGLETASSAEQGGQLLSSPGERRAARAAATARALEESLELLEGVNRARVHLILPATARVRLPGAAPVRARASVLLRVSKAHESHNEFTRQLLLGAVENLVPQDVHVVTVEERPIADAPLEFVPLGPITVSAESAPLLKGILGSLIVSVLLLAVSVCFLVVRQRRRAS
jgi:type III secretory pathway lipoprotein EscJ